MKTIKTTEEMSSHPGEKRAWEHKRASEHAFAREKPKTDWKNGLQICGEGTKSRKRPTPVVGKNPNGKYQLIYSICRRALR
jgi:NADH:ubiquinone oxidoreductase subunit